MFWAGGLPYAQSEAGRASAGAERRPEIGRAAQSGPGAGASAPVPEPIFAARPISGRRSAPVDARTAPDSTQGSLASENILVAEMFPA